MPKIEVLVAGAQEVAALKIEVEDETEGASPPKTEAFEELPPKTELL